MAIGDSRGSGLFVHSLLALTPAGEVLGLAAQHSWARASGPPRKHTETRAQRQVRPGKESEVWPQLLETVGPVPSGQRRVSVGDRGSDSFDYWARAVASGWHCLSRIFTNRRTADNGHLLTQARNLRAQSQIVVPQRARPGQAARTLHLNLAWYMAQVLPPRHNPVFAHRPPLTASIVRCWDDRYGVEWLLLATWPVDRADDKPRVFSGMNSAGVLRSSISASNPAVKSGDPNSSRPRLSTCCWVFVVWSRSTCWRWPVWRACGQTPSLRTLSTRPSSPLGTMRRLEPTTLTVRDYWRAVARIGGFLARTRDGDPGWKTLWQGLMELEHWVLAWDVKNRCRRSRLARAPGCSKGAGYSNRRGARRRAGSRRPNSQCPCHRHL